MMTAPPTNRLYFGDNLPILREQIADESVDLIYLDPPFNSNATYNVLFQERSGEQSAAQVTAFEDTWRWGLESEIAYREVVANGPRHLSDLLQAMRGFLGQNDMMAYLAMMAPRMAELHRVLKPTGSIYLHCDQTAGHLLRLLLDAIFGAVNFKTQIVWKRTSAHSDTRQGRRQHGRIQDNILFTTKSNRWTWNPVYTPYDRNYLEEQYRYVEPETGRRYRLSDMTGPGGTRRGNPMYEVMGVTRAWRYSRERMQELIAEGRVVQTSPGAVPRYKRYLDEMPGVPLQDIWTDIPPIGARSAERIGYPTQKPEALLDRIIRASSNEGDLILDPFCGCGTATAVAERLNRRWVGIDITHLAVSLMRYRLHHTFGDGLQPYAIIGDPKDLASARALALESEHDGRYQFQYWALSLVEGLPARNDRQRGADSGIDGIINFFDDNSSRAKRIIIQVKSGNVSVSDIRDLRGTLERERAQIALFITLNPPTRPMLEEAAAAGFYEPEHFPDHHFPRLQILTIEELLAGAAAQYPRFAPTVAYGGRPARRAPRRRLRESPQTALV